MEQRILNLLKEHNAEHLLMFYNELTDSEKIELINSIELINFEQIKEVLSQKQQENSKDLIQAIESSSKENYSKEEIEKISKIGEEIIKTGKYAIITMAGGQGTRLGHTGPKGTYKLSFKDRQRYIFEIFIDNLKAIYKKHNIYLNWYIMTSISNNKETIEFFEKNNYFGYPKNKVKFFSQGELPITDLEGNVVLEQKSKVFMAADGNGGIFNALVKNNIVEELKENKVDWVLITGVDNILVNMADEFYIGLVHSDKKLNGVKSVAKITPEERVGVFCRRNGKPSVIEYSEMTDSVRNAKDDNGNLLFADANIVNHLINIEVIEKIKNKSLPIHKAIKRLDYIDKNGNLLKPTEPCLIKFETFIFDYFNMVEDTTVYRVNRNEEFAPVKNKEGEDSPYTAVKLYNELYFKEV